MRDIRIIKGRYIVPDEETALKLAGYRSGSPDWETGRARFQELEPEIKRHIQPKAALAFIEDRQERGLFIILTLGSAVTRRADAFFDSRDYLSGVLFDAMAGSCLFAFEKQLLPQIKVICQEKGCGIACRHEAGMDIPLSVQAEAAAAVAAERTLGVRVTEDMVLLPAQSMCIVFDLSRDPSVFRLEHDCRSCTQNHCPTRGGENGCAYTLPQRPKRMADTAGTGHLRPGSLRWQGSMRKMPDPCLSGANPRYRGGCCLFFSRRSAEWLASGLPGYS
jgi:hypothetical protein